MARAALQWSLEDLANKTGISMSTIARFEIGQHKPKKLYLKLIREKFEDAGVEFRDDRWAAAPPGGW
jgi:transcriptional regulator with XRE-family HTH domain